MTIATSLKTRVRRLEETLRTEQRLGLAELINRARARSEAMTPEERAADHLQQIDREVDAFIEHPNGWPEGDEAPFVRMAKDFRNLGARLERARWRVGREHVFAMLSLDEPDAQEPAANDYSRPNVERLWAWQRQQHRRKAARSYLSDIEEAKGLYTPRHWPLPTTVLELVR